MQCEVQETESDETRKETAEEFETIDSQTDLSNWIRPAAAFDPKKIHNQKSSEAYTWNSLGLRLPFRENEKF